MTIHQFIDFGLLALAVLFATGALSAFIMLLVRKFPGDED